MANMKPVNLSPNREGRTIEQGDANETPLPKERAINPDMPVGDGPVVDEKGAHRPARFKLDNGTIVTHR